MTISASHIFGKKILITGGAGFIGAALANKLAHENQVVAIDNLSSGDWSRCSEKVQKVEIDLLKASQEILNGLFAGVDFVFHLAAVKLNSPNTSGATLYRNNVEVCVKVFRASSINKVKKILFTSSLYAYGSQGLEIMEEQQPTSAKNFYGISKLAGENLLQVESAASNMEFVNARLFFIYGPGQYAEGGYKSVIMKTFELKSKMLPAEIYGSGSQVLDYVFIDDCILALTALMANQFQGTVNISTGKGVSISSLIGMINSRFGNNDVIFRPADLTEGTLRVGSPHKLNEVLRWHPSTTIENGLEHIWEWWNA
jgi:UDP-glucose 4-epimerase